MYLSCTRGQVQSQKKGEWKNYRVKCDRLVCTAALLTRFNVAVNSNSCVLGLLVVIFLASATAAIDEIESLQK